MENYRYDVHCHIFTLKYVLKEAKSFLHDVLLGTYPWHVPGAKRMFAARENLSVIKDFLRQLYEMVRASAGSEEENLDFLQKEAHETFPSDKLRIVPLMMDIFYMFAYRLDKDKDIIESNRNHFVSVDKTIFQENWDDILEDFSGYIKKMELPRFEKSVSETEDRINQMLTIIEEERPVKTMMQNKINREWTTGLQGFYQTEGFVYHMNNLMDLVGTRKEELFPFVAIDPRREGVIDCLLSGSFITGEKRFYGVKLYPRMGYHPQCIPLDAVYRYCSENRLPVTFHCGLSGFPPGEKWKHAQFGNPLNFEPVVKKYPELRINFAHFGSSDPSGEWARTIVRLINDNDNVYTDLSCYTKKEDLDGIVPYWNNNPKLKNRLMFGTDFDVMYFTDLITMRDYYANFESVFKEDLRLLMHDNPVRFLGLEG
jgi:predicted TIM-barrel fold metal-dependent hydrolase